MNLNNNNNNEKKFFKIKCSSLMIQWFSVCVCVCVWMFFFLSLKLNIVHIFDIWNWPKVIRLSFACHSIRFDSFLYFVIFFLLYFVLFDYLTFRNIFVVVVEFISIDHLLFSLFDGHLNDIQIYLIWNEILLFFFCRLKQKTFRK